MILNSYHIFHQSSLYWTQTHIIFYVQYSLKTKNIPALKTKLLEAYEETVLPCT